MPGAGRSFRALSLWLLVALAAIVIVQQLHRSQSAGTEISYSEFWQAVQEQRVEEVTIVRRDVTGKYRETADAEARRFHTYLPTENDPELLEALRGAGDPGRPRVRIQSKPDPTPWFSVLLSWLPFVLLIGIWFFMIRQMQSGGSAALKFGKSRARLLQEHKARVTFESVAGADEAKQELEEVIEFLRSPRKFRRLGGRIPKGVLLIGPPGTGKTLLARAVAGEANVPFFSISGSDFVEMFVGVGAARVRDLFEQGKRHAPCIVFVDELDAVGRHRGAGLGGGHDEREQTLNQLLVEMDGFDANEGVILLSATNRPDVLDPALLRPGRFDRVVVVDRPDVRGREGILKVHCRNKPLAPDVDLQILARATPGLSGADLENIVNEAALLAARRDQEAIRMTDLEEAKDKVMMGTERRSLIIPDDEKRITAYHEAGHALVAWFMPEADPLHKVTIIPRGQALGLTHWLPTDDRHIRTKAYLEQMMVASMGGRAAEELIFHRFTTGAASDISSATQLARRMVCQWGMSEKLGPIQFGSKDELIFLGKEISQQRDYSERTAQLIDEEVNRIVTTAYTRAREILEDNRETLDRLAQALLEREILDREEVGKIIAGGSAAPGTGEAAPEGAPAAGAGAAAAAAPTDPAATVDPAPRAAAADPPADPGPPAAGAETPEVPPEKP
ncbi:MAG: ATP-dependent zinc metalloprotease FtsH [Candidatus Eisenbacteria bacterium]|uniref:ATP-dependent zinc metalloprotease FtsH n=1 Tax=Eiseniibacteriota bacterium TaxID=2212470 RepID=A0A937XAD9_UNCEI|nr:ATP-dependent zinc metalloprotease FtsH [Candidatus Eisenbacteria bacterium]